MEETYIPICSVISKLLSTTLIHHHLDRKTETEIFLLSPTQLNLPCQQYFMTVIAFIIVTAVKILVLTGSVSMLTFTSRRQVLMHDSLSQWLLNSLHCSLGEWFTAVDGISFEKFPHTYYSQCLSQFEKGI